MNTSSSSSTGAAPTRSPTTRGRPAAARAPATAARPATRGCAPAVRRSTSSRSSRCGPTECHRAPHVVVRATSAARRRARRGHGGSYLASTSAWPARFVVRACAGPARACRRARVARPRDAVAGCRPDLASHTSSVEARLAATWRPPACFRSALRWRRIRSRSVRSASCFGLSATRSVVEVATPLRRTALHQREVVGREHRDPQHAEQVASARAAAAGSPGPGCGRRALSSASIRSSRPSRRRPRPARPPSSHPRGRARRSARHGTTVSVRQVADRLEQVGLALAVVADDRGEPGAELELGVERSAEVGEPEPAHPHGETHARGRCSRHPDRHEQVQEVRGTRASAGPPASGVERLEHDLVAVDGLDAVEQVVRVERDGQLGALVLGARAPRRPCRRPG